MHVWAAAWVQLGSQCEFYCFGSFVFFCSQTEKVDWQVCIIYSAWIQKCRNIMQRLAAPPHSKRVDGWMDEYKKKKKKSTGSLHFILSNSSSASMKTPLHCHKVPHKLQSVCLLSTVDYSRMEGIKKWEGNWSRRYTGGGMAVSRGGGWAVFDLGRWKGSGGC